MVSGQDDIHGTDALSQFLGEVVAFLEYQPIDTPVTEIDVAVIDLCLEDLIMDAIALVACTDEGTRRKGTKSKDTTEETSNALHSLWRQVAVHHHGSALALCHGPRKDVDVRILQGRLKPLSTVQIPQ